VNTAAASIKHQVLIRSKMENSRRHAVLSGFIA